MSGTSQYLRVSYGTFSCTVQGFADNLQVMKDVAAHFRDLVSEAPEFGLRAPEDAGAFAEAVAGHLSAGPHGAAAGATGPGGLVFTAETDTTLDGASLDGPEAIDATLRRLEAESHEGDDVAVEGAELAEDGLMTDGDESEGDLGEEAEVSGPEDSVAIGSEDREPSSEEVMAASDGADAVSDETADEALADAPPALGAEDAVEIEAGSGATEDDAEAWLDADVMAAPEPDTDVDACEAAAGDEPEDGSSEDGAREDSLLADAVAEEPEPVEAAAADEVDGDVVASDEVAPDEKEIAAFDAEAFPDEEAGEDDPEEDRGRADPLASLGDADFAETEPAPAPVERARLAEGRSTDSLLDDMFGEEAVPRAAEDDGGPADGWDADADRPATPAARPVPAAMDEGGIGFGAELARLLDEAAEDDEDEDDGAELRLPHRGSEGAEVHDLAAAAGRRRDRVVTHDTVPEEAIDRLMHDAEDRIEAAETGGHASLQRIRHVVHAAGVARRDDEDEDDEDGLDEVPAHSDASDAPAPLETAPQIAATWGDDEDTGNDADHGDEDEPVGPAAAPMVLVHSQRVDQVTAFDSTDNGDDAEGSADDGSDAPSPPHVEGTAAALAALWAQRALVALDDRMMAAASLIANASRDGTFTRPEVMELFAEATGGPELPPEERMRAFGLLLRHGRIRRAGRGLYATAQGKTIPAE